MAKVFEQNVELKVCDSACYVKKELLRGHPLLNALHLTILEESQIIVEALENPKLSHTSSCGQIMNESACHVLQFPYRFITHTLSLTLHSAYPRLAKDVIYSISAQTTVEFSIRTNKQTVMVLECVSQTPYLGHSQVKGPFVVAGIESTIK